MGAKHANLGNALIPEKLKMIPQSLDLVPFLELHGTRLMDSTVVQMVSRMLASCLISRMEVDNTSGASMVGLLTAPCPKIRFTDAGVATAKHLFLPSIKMVLRVVRVRVQFLHQAAGMVGLGMVILPSDLVGDRI